ncbi:MAG: S41 family peptidase [Pseudonocardia sp.]
MTTTARRERADLDAAQRGVPLSELLATAAGRELVSGRLDGAQRQQVLDTLIEVIGGAYAHLPAKRAAYAIDPVQALVLLRRRAGELSDADFHLAVTHLVIGLRDAHTRYIGPSSLRGRVAALPFMVEQYGPSSQPGFLVTKVAADVARRDPAFVPGVRLTWWNGIPFGHAVDLYADRETGGRPDARRARALESFTFRALDYGPPPDEYWVILGYRTRRGAHRELRLPWRVLEPGVAADAVDPATDPAAGRRMAVDPAAEAVRRAKKLLFAPRLWAADAHPDPAERAVPAGAAIETPMQDFLAARVVRARRHRLGYLRIWSFGVRHVDAFLDEVGRLLDLLPRGGLIVDLRGNPGGLVWAAERLLQLFTDNPVVPARFSLLASPLTREMARSDLNQAEFAAWRHSLDDAVATGELWAQPRPLTPPEWCNDLGRRYPGPAVAVVDPNTYSAGDLFAAGWVDNDLGPLVTVGHATGAGGANVWTARQMQEALDGTEHQLRPLPAGTSFTVAIRRAIRSGRGDGIPLEDLGVTGTPATTYQMTERDLLSGNHDLLAFCADVLQQWEH